MMRRVVIVGAAGRDFHNFNVVFRDAATTSTSSPSPPRRSPTSTGRRYPPELAGRALSGRDPDRRRGGPRAS